MKPLKQLRAWKSLEQHFKSMRSFDMRAAFCKHASRFEQLFLRARQLHAWIDCRHPPAAWT